jgi:hypothetical protein
MNKFYGNSFHDNGTRKNVNSWTTEGAMNEDS